MIKTPQTDPDHGVVGKYWGGHSIKQGKTAIYYCDSYDSSCGFWMTNIHDRSDRVNISDRAPLRTYWPAEDKGSYFYISQWGVLVEKPYRCPQCGWWPNADQVKQRLVRSEPVRNDRHSAEFGVEAFDWTETWKCPNDGTVFTFTDSNC